MSQTPFLEPGGYLHRLIYGAKKVFPSSLWARMTKPYWWWYNRGRHQLAGFANPIKRQSANELKDMRDSHRGERCFIIGNGPSLQKMDLSPLRNEITFGMNRIYLLFPQMGFEPTYYVSINTLVIEQCAEDIQRLSMPKFITWRGRQWLRGDPRTVFLDTDYTDPPGFSADVSGRVYEGSTVTYVALQLAFHMGFEEVILIGVDHNFSMEGQPNETVVSTGGDADHFSPEYFGKGFRWQLPDLEASERAYIMARKAFDGAGRKVLDATVDGKLEIFPKVKYSDFWKSENRDH